MTFPTNNPKIAKIFANAMAHSPKGNVVRFIAVSESSDGYLGTPGQLQRVARDMKYEPRVCAIPVDVVRKNGSMYRYSDMVMLVAKDDLTDEEANDSANEFLINDVAYSIKNFRPA